MPTSPPLPVPAAGVAPPRSSVRPPSKPVPLGGWQYACTRRSKPLLTAAILASVGIHVGVLFGIRHAAKKPAPPAAVPTLQLAITMPLLKELEEPDPVPNDDAAKPDLGQPIPMQADVPSAALPTDFVQQFDFASLIERPDLSDMKILSIPENIRRPGKLMEGVKIFDLSALDRIPEAVVQSPPIYPVGRRREGLAVTVRVMFHVEVDGRVTNAHVLTPDNREFDDAAVTGVSKWRFRAGVKDGRKVVTRMMVPIVFSPVDTLDLKG
jgi:protein TonB